MFVKIRKYILGFSFGLVLSLGVGMWAPVPVNAITCNSSNEEVLIVEGRQVCCPKGTASSVNSKGEKVADASSCVFRKYINPAIYLLSILAGVAVVGGLTYGGILYASSAGEAGKITKAKAVIIKALTGLVVFLLLAPFIRFMSPGGVNSVTIANPTAAACSSANQFLGLKPWFAYLPDNSFNANCSLKDNVSFWPTQKGSSETYVSGVLPRVVLAVVDDLLRIAAIVAVVFVIVGGIQYMTSQGEPAQVKQSLSAIINALIGLAIAVVAAAVVSFIGRSLTS